MSGNVKSATFISDGQEWKYSVEQVQTTFFGVDIEGKEWTYTIQKPENALNLVLESECRVTLEELNSAGITDIQFLSKEDYQSLENKVPTVLYLITC